MNADVNPPKRKRVRKRHWLPGNVHDDINAVERRLIDLFGPEGPLYGDPGDPDDPDYPEDEHELVEATKWLAELAHKGVEGKQPLSLDEWRARQDKERKHKAALEKEVFAPLRILYLKYARAEGKKNATARCIEEALTLAKKKGIDTRPREGHFDRLLVEQNKAKRRPKR